MNAEEVAQQNSAPPMKVAELINEVLRSHGGDILYDSLMKECFSKAKRRTVYDNYAKMKGKELIEYIDPSGERRVHLLDQLKGAELEYFSDCLKVIRRALNVGFRKEKIYRCRTCSMEAMWNEEEQMFTYIISLHGGSHVIPSHSDCELWLYMKEKRKPDFSKLDEVEAPSDEQLHESFSYLRSLTYGLNFRRIILLSHLKSDIFPLIEELVKSQECYLVDEALYILGDILKNLWGYEIHHAFAERALTLLKDFMDRLPALISKWKEKQSYTSWTPESIEDSALRCMLLTGDEGINAMIAYVIEHAERFPETPSRIPKIEYNFPEALRLKLRAKRLELLGHKDEKVRKLFKYAWL